MGPIRDLIEQFAHSPMNIRLEVTRKILEFGAQAIPDLLEGLNHPVWSVRQDCANALAELKDPSTTPFLIFALADPETGVRYEAARALGRIGTDEAKNALHELARGTDNAEFRYFLYECLDGKA